MCYSTCARPLHPHTPLCGVVALSQGGGFNSSLNVLPCIHHPCHHALPGTWRGQEVAIKVMPHGWRTGARMARELDLSTRLNHPAVVRSLFYCTVDTKT